MNKSFLIAYKLMFFLIPIPLFFDFGSMQLITVYINDFNPLFHRPAIPMPIGGIAFALAIIIGYVGSIFYKKQFQSVFTPAKLLLFYSLVVIPISIYSVFVSELSFSRLAQLLLPMIFISLLSFPVLLKDRLELLRNTFLSGFVFFNLHFLSIVISSNDFLDVNPNIEFSNLFGFLIYQSLVSYPAVITLYLFLTIALIYVTRKEILPGLKKYKYFAYYFIFVLLYLLAASGRRAFLVEYIGSLVIISVFSIIYISTNRFVKKKTVWFLFLFLLLFFSFFVFYINTPLSQRVLTSIDQNTFDSGRVNILGNAFDFFTNNLSVLFFGGGERERPGFHNFILDQIYRIGLVGMLSVYLTMVLLVRRFVKVNDTGTDFKYHRRMFLFILLGSLFLQSMINASVSQPYYFVNFLIVTVFVYFVLFARKDSNLKSQPDVHGVI